MNHTFLHRILFFFIGILIYQSSIAQDYIITTKGDTLKGKVKILSYAPEKKVQIINDQEKKTISIFSTRAVILNGETYHPVKNDTGYIFMKLMKDGYLSLYSYQVDNQLNYDGLYLVMKDNRRMQVPNLSFKKIMTNFLESDCPYLTLQVSNGTLGRKNLNQIIDDFNKCIADKTITIKQTNDTADALTEQLNPWDDLELKVKAYTDFDKKADALDMITEIKNKIKLTNKIPNYLVDGLKSALSQTSLKEELDSILKLPEIPPVTKTIK